MVFNKLAILLFFASNAFAAVLTVVPTKVYFPLAHNTLPASENGELFYLGDKNGVTTYLFQEPQSPSLLATFIAGNSVAEIIVSANPTFIASYACDIHATEAVCLAASINPQNGDIISATRLDSVDSIEMLVALPATTSSPPRPTRTHNGVTSQTASPTRMHTIHKA